MGNCSTAPTAFDIYHSKHDLPTPEWFKALPGGRFVRTNACMHWSAHFGMVQEQYERNVRANRAYSGLKPGMVLAHQNGP